MEKHFNTLTKKQIITHKIINKYSNIKLTNIKTSNITQHIKTKSKTHT